MCDLVLVLELVLDRTRRRAHFFPGSFRCDQALLGPLVNFEDEFEDERSELVRQGF
jgi:hypothetical protein